MNIAFISLVVVGLAGSDPPASVPLHVRLETQLRGHRSLADDYLVVETSGLVVTLSGRVDSDAERKRAVRIVRRDANPPQIVEDRLRVVEPASSHGRRPDRAAVERELRRQLAAIAPVEVEVSGKRRLRVRLSGELPSVDSHLRILRAIRAAAEISELVDDTVVARPPRSAG